jgi:hypothetical protein
MRRDEKLKTMFGAVIEAEYEGEKKGWQKREGDAAALCFARAGGRPA